MNIREIIEDIFGINGKPSFLEKTNPKFKIRPQQNDVIKEVLNAMKDYDIKNILMEAPTGTGKTFIYSYITILDYLLKLLYKTEFQEEIEKMTQKPYICIVTNNKALQKQLATDLDKVIIPTLIKYFNHKSKEEKAYEKLSSLAQAYLNVGVYKSKSNYLCSTLFSRYASRDDNVGSRTVAHIKKAQISQGTLSIDYDMLDRTDEKGNFVADDKVLTELSCRNSDPKTCDNKNCKCHRKLEHANIMITNYDYIFLLSRVIKLDFIKTFVFDECHNMPQKLINNSEESFNIIDFHKNIEATKSEISKSKEVEDFSIMLEMVTIPMVKKIFEKNSSKGTVNITFGIDKNTLKEYNVTDSTLPFETGKPNSQRMAELLSDEMKKAKEIITQLDEKESVNEIIKIYRRETTEMVLSLLRAIATVRNEGNIQPIRNEISVYKSSTKIKGLCENCKDMVEENLLERYDFESMNYVQELDDEKMSCLENLFAGSEVIKEAYRRAHRIEKTLSQAIQHSRTIKYLKKYMGYIRQLIEILEGKRDEVDEEYTNPDVIILESFNDDILNITKINDVTPELYSRFLGQSDAQKIIYSSATMTTNGNYKFFIEQLGLEDDNTWCCDIPESPFDKRNRQWIFLSHELASKNSYGGKEQNYKEILRTELSDIASANPNGTLVLCTSRDDVKNAYECTKGMKSRSVHSQYMSALPTIIHEAHNGKNPAVVIGNTGFWEGLDMQGEIMTMVVISKLPFANPTDPQIISWYSRALFSKIETGERGNVSSKHWGYCTNLMKITFYQGIGRLLRGVSDYGAILCLFSKNKGLFNWNLFKEDDIHLGFTPTNTVEAANMEQVCKIIEFSMKATKKNAEKYK